MGSPTDDEVERVAQAIDAADVGYIIRLTRLLDDEATYTLTIDGGRPLEFPSNGDAADHVARIRSRAKAEAAIAALSTRSPSAIRLSDLEATIEAAIRELMPALGGCDLTSPIFKNLSRAYLILRGKSGAVGSVNLLGDAGEARCDCGGSWTPYGLCTRCGGDISEQEALKAEDGWS